MTTGKRQFHFGEWLRENIESMGLEVKQFAARIPVSEARVHGWLRAQSPSIRGANIGKLAKALDIRKSQIDVLLEAARRGVKPELAKVAFDLGGQMAVELEKAVKGGAQIGWDARERVEQIVRQQKNGEAGLDRNVDPYSEEGLPGEIPTFEMSVAAGTWVDVSDVGEICDPRQIDHGLFRVRIRGDSMKPAYKDGELVEFRCLREGRDPLLAGKDYYIQRDGEATFKRLEKFDEEQMTFRALNKKKYPKPIVVARADVRRMARALAKVTLV